MLAHFLEASVMFQNSDVYLMYAIIFGVLGVICVTQYISACKSYEEDNYEG